MPSVAWHRSAAQELIEAADFLASERTSLGEMFLQDAARCLASIVERPEAGPSMGPLVRRRLFRRFPYAILYRETGSEIRILAVAHLRRRPAYWRDRIEPDASS